MADPASAIGLAASIVQLLILTSGLLKKTREVYKSTNGATDAGNQLEVVATSISRLLNDVVINKTPFYRNEGSAAGEELLKLSEGCEEVCRELLGALDRLKSESGQRASQSFRQALRFVWNEKKISALADRIEAYRRQIDTALLMNIRERIDHLTTRVDFSDAKATMVNDLIQTTIEKKWQPTRQNDVQSFSYMFAQLTKEQRAESIRIRILTELMFREMRDRYEAVHEAYEKTFDWILVEPEEEQKEEQEDELTSPAPKGQLDNFVEWLRSPESIYWITGKPGSGKSTLMKYLYDHQKTDRNLCRWHQSRPLIKAGFFFWNSGTEEQMSQTGLYRSLLYQILEPRPDLVPLAFPGIWKSYETIGGISEFISLQDLTTALKTIVRDESKRFIFFIDGMDEFSGDHSELAELMTTLASEGNVKLCLSSRPYLVFEEKFRSKRWLRLEELTYNDISLYVRERMQSSEMFCQMRSVMGERVGRLTTDITEKACGVFLWVRLVVATLLEGLRDGDTMEELEEKLLTLPSDLEELFMEILNNRIEGKYLPQACELFVLFRATTLPFTLLDLALARQGYEAALSAPVRCFSDHELRFYSEQMRRFISSRCKGLLEVPKVEAEGHEARIEFLHRSVREFLGTPKIVRFIHSNVSKDYDPHMILGATYLARTKSLQPFYKRDMDHQTESARTMLSEFWVVFDSAITYINQVEDDDLHFSLVNEARRSAKAFWGQQTDIPISSGESRHGAHPKSKTCLQLFLETIGARKGDWETTRFHRGDTGRDTPIVLSVEEGAFLDFAMGAGLDRYVRMWLKKDDNMETVLRHKTSWIQLCEIRGYDELKMLLMSHNLEPKPSPRPSRKIPFRRFFPSKIARRMEDEPVLSETGKIIVYTCFS